MARVHQLNVSPGGVPKTAVPSAEVTELGLRGDRQAKPAIHGGPYRALCLFPLEHIEALAAQGHPITPGSVGENVTTAGLDWSRLAVGTRLRLGERVRIRITSYAAPCSTIRPSFADRDVSRVNHQRSPGWSRLYAEVLESGRVAPGDPIEIEPTDPLEREPIAPELAVRALSQVQVPVSELERGIAFYRDVLGATYLTTIDPPGLGMLQVGDVVLMLDPPQHRGEGAAHSAQLYFRVDDIHATFSALRDRGVDFAVAPFKQYENNGVEGWMAFFADPDGNELVLVSEVPRQA